MLLWMPLYIVTSLYYFCILVFYYFVFYFGASVLGTMRFALGKNSKKSIFLFFKIVGAICQFSRKFNVRLQGIAAVPLCSFFNKTHFSDRMKSWYWKIHKLWMMSFSRFFWLFPCVSTWFLKSSMIFVFLYHQHSLNSCLDNLQKQVRKKSNSIKDRQ